MPLCAGDELGRYKILAHVGSGGMGEVYRARDTRLNRDVAIKVLPQGFAGDAARERFHREARAASALNHPNICTVHDVGESNGHPFLVMELLQGKTLAEHISARPLDVATAVDLSAQVADALDAAHSRGIIHRDIKPANIFVTARGHAKVLDFGLATQRGPLDSEALTEGILTQPGSALGTVAYMSPEQARGQSVDERTDLWSFGVVLYEMVAGSRPFEGSTIATIFDAILHRVPRPIREWNPKTPTELERIVLKLLEKDRELRYRSAAEVRDDLVRLKGSSAPTPGVRMRSARSRWTWPGVAVGLALVAAAWFAVRPVHAKLTDRDTILIADFVNRTGDPAFDDILREGVTVQLQQSPFLSLVPDQKIRATLALMGKPPGTALTGDTARVVCTRVGARAVLTGSITSLGTHYIMNLRADGCANGDSLDNEQADADGKQQVLKSLGDMAASFRSRAGETLAMVREHNVPLQEATTSSLEALKAYTDSMTTAGTSGEDDVRRLKRAVELDPQFASAWSFLAIGYSNLGETGLSRDCAARAYEVREHASGPEKFNIEYSYHRNVTGNLEKAWASNTLWRATYPRDPEAFALSGGYAANGTGRFAEAVVLAEQAIRMNPEMPVVYGSKAELLFRLGRLQETAKALSEAEARHANLLVVRYRLALLTKDSGTAEATVAVNDGADPYNDLRWQLRALAAAQQGRLADAEDYSRHALEIARANGHEERAAVMRSAQGVWNSFYGESGAARQAAAAALKASGGREVQFAAGFALALAGDAARADAIAAKLDYDHREDTQVQATYVPALRALSALARNDAAKAVDLLEANRPYEFAIPPLAFNHSFGNMYPLYVRGLAYLALHRERDAAAEFSRLLAHPWLSAGDPVDAAARRQLARALALAGDTAKARLAYNDILTLWKNADAGLAMVKQTRAESVSLQ